MPGIIKPGLAIRIGSAIKEINRRIDDIEVPALVCGSFSDHNLHSQGSINGFRRVTSAHKWLYTHRGPKWATYYSPQVLATQARFFDHFLRDQDTGLLDEPSIRLEVRGNRDTVTSVRHVPCWPPSDTTWRSLPGFRTIADPWHPARLATRDGQFVPVQAPRRPGDLPPSVSRRHRAHRTDAAAPDPVHHRHRHRTRNRHPQVDQRVEQGPRPFVWAKTADEILETLAAYCERIIGSEH